MVYRGGNWFSRLNLDSIARIELSDWEELTDCFMFLDFEGKIRIDKDSRQAILKYKNIEFIDE